MMTSAVPLIPTPPVGGIGDCTAAKVRRLARRISQIYDDALAPYDLTVGQIGLLASLRRREGIGIGALAERLAADASTISRLLKPLAAAGYLCVEPDSADRRAKLVRLTDRGHEQRRLAAQGWQAAQDRVRNALGDGRLAALAFILDDSHSRL